MRGRFVTAEEIAANAVKLSGDVEYLRNLNLLTDSELERAGRETPDDFEDTYLAVQEAANHATRDSEVAKFFREQGVDPVATLERLEPHRHFL